MDFRFYIYEMKHFLKEPNRLFIGQYISYSGNIVAAISALNGSYAGV